MFQMFKQLSREDRNKVKTTDRNVTDSTFVRSKVHVSVLKLGVKPKLQISTEKADNWSVCETVSLTSGLLK